MIETKPALPKYCNCGVCSRPLSSQDVFRRMPYGERSVPLCGRCGVQNNEDIEVRLAGGRDAEVKG